MIKKSWDRWAKDNSDIKRNFYYMKVKGVIHDGITEPMHFQLFDMLYPLFIISGLSIFMLILMKWEVIKKILGIN